MIRTNRTLVSALFFVFLSTGCGLYDGVFNDPVSDENDKNQLNNDNNDPEDPCEGCAGLCIDDQCRAVTQIVAGARHSCALLDAGDVACWGDNGAGQLGGDGGEHGTPQLVDGLEAAVSLSGGWEHSCAVVESGAVYCWGNNAERQLGGGDDVAQRATPETVVGLDDVEAVAAGYNHSCAAHGGGAVSCWGSDLLGQIGQGESDGEGDHIVATPTAVQGLFGGGSAVRAISAGWFTSAVVDSSGELNAWGDNENHQLAQSASELEYASSPTVVELSGDISSVSTGWRHICAVVDDQLLCWGNNQTRQLGRSSIDDRSQTPSPVEALTDVNAMDTGWGGHSCAASDDGAYCWGDSSSGQVGDGQSGADTVIGTPERVLEQEAIDVGIGLEHSCALTASGELYCWGSNRRGQLGLGSSVDEVAQPQLVE